MAQTDAASRALTSASDAQMAVVGDFDPAAIETDTLSLELTCTNRDLPAPEPGVAHAPALIWPAMNVFGTVFFVIALDQGGRHLEPGALGQLLEQVRTVPGIKSAALITKLPLEAGTAGLNTFEIEGQANTGIQRDMPLAFERPSSAGYFETMRIPLVRGRIFTKQDNVEAPPSVTGPTKIRSVDTSITRAEANGSHWKSSELSAR